ncbi:hypothetical protein [Streptomyces sp. NPDC007984]|uniref:hypothetical protein n=1 Tax=Streptomyces sp. NPDC007984 TaxID=3364801 RepID=UPI0036E7E9A5
MTTDPAGPSNPQPTISAAVERTRRRIAAFTSLPPSQRTIIDGSGWWPPTLFAAEHQDAELLARLLDAGADPDEGNGGTPLTHALDAEGDGALQSGAPLTVATTAVLLAYGADPNALAIRMLHRHLQRDRTGKVRRT